ncbi:MAG: hypothetical protein OEZ59_05700 [Deltaproteobacteria bacterium]|nr:hypothetical protein [Deltaproteobacteria bacterium]
MRGASASPVRLLWPFMCILLLLSLAGCIIGEARVNIPLRQGELKGRRRVHYLPYEGVVMFSFKKMPVYFPDLPRYRARELKMGFLENRIKTHVVVYALHFKKGYVWVLRHLDNRVYQIDKEADYNSTVRWFGDSTFAISHQTVMGPEISSLYDMDDRKWTLDVESLFHVSEEYGIYMSGPFETGPGDKRKLFRLGQLKGGEKDEVYFDLPAGAKLTGARFYAARIKLFFEKQGRTDYLWLNTRLLKGYYR